MFCRQITSLGKSTFWLFAENYFALTGVVFFGCKSRQYMYIHTH